MIALAQLSHGYSVAYNFAPVRSALELPIAFLSACSMYGYLVFSWSSEPFAQSLFQGIREGEIPFGVPLYPIPRGLLSGPTT